MMITVQRIENLGKKALSSSANRNDSPSRDDPNRGRRKSRACGEERVPGGGRRRQGDQDCYDDQVALGEEEEEEDGEWEGRPLQRVSDWSGSLTRRMEGRAKQKRSCLAALLPGADIRDPNHVLVNTATSREVVKFNIGGTIFETYRSTLTKIPHSPLADDVFLRRHYQEDRNIYFFDRDPEVFGAILNYLRTGELHLPTKFCGPAVKNEMEFWGIDDDEIEECCWNSFSAWATTLEALQKLEKDRKDWDGAGEFEDQFGTVNMPGSVDHIVKPDGSSPVSRYQKIQMLGWEILNSPNASIAAQVYSYVSLTFVVVSIFSFVAQTHDYFRVTVEEETVLTTTTPLPPGTVTNASVVTNTTAATSTEPVKDSHPAMLYIDAVCLCYFLLEFAVRISLAPRKCKLLILPMTVFELLALVPDLIEFGVRIFQPNLRKVAAVDVITFLRLLRVFRIFRLMRHFPGLWILFYTLKASVKELLLLLLFLCVGMLFFASLIYYTDDRSEFTSIPMACWWSIITMTTVGYGDFSPKTNLGYVVGSMTAICGVLVIGFTVPVLVNNFILYYQHTQCAISRDGAKKRRQDIKDHLKKQEQKEKEEEEKLASLIASASSHNHPPSTDAGSPEVKDERMLKMERLRKLMAEGISPSDNNNDVDGDENNAEDRGKDRVEGEKDESENESVKFKGQNGGIHKEDSSTAETVGL